MNIYCLFSRQFFFIHTGIIIFECRNDIRLIIKCSMVGSRFRGTTSNFRLSIGSTRCVCTFIFRILNQHRLLSANSILNITMYSLVGSFLFSERNVTSTFFIPFCCLSISVHVFHFSRVESEMRC